MGPGLNFMVFISYRGLMKNKEKEKIEQMILFQLNRLRLRFEQHVLRARYIYIHQVSKEILKSTAISGTIPQDV